MAMNISFHERLIENKDWATLLFVLCLALIAITRSAFEKRFSDFLRILFSDKYIKIYKDGSNLTSWFSIFLFLIQLVSFAFFIQLLLQYFGYASKSDWVIFIRLLTFLGVFILSKYLVEKIIATSFNIEEILEQFNLQKVSYRTFMGLLLFPVNLILYYNSTVPISVIYFVLFVLLAINTATYLNSLKMYQNLIFGKLFYFILYLCALEIAPYYFMYYWFTRS